MARDVVKTGGITVEHLEPGKKVVGEKNRLSPLPRNLRRNRSLRSPLSRLWILPKPTSRISARRRATEQGAAFLRRARAVSQTVSMTLPTWSARSSSAWAPAASVSGKVL